jgi:hypothetical protein
MAEDDEGVAGDLAWVDEHLAAPDSGLDRLRGEFPFLQSAADARRFLEGIRAGLEDVAAGRVVPHEVVVRDMEERRLRYRSSAAE